MHRPTLRDFRRLTDHAEFSEDDARYDTSGAGAELVTCRRADVQGAGPTLDYGVLRLVGG